MSSQDCLVWKSHPDQNFSFKDAWQLTKAHRHFAHWSNWVPMVWNSLQLPRVSFFAWRLLHHKTATQVLAQSAGLNLASRSCLCKADLESTPHLLFFCSFAYGIWYWVLNSAGAAVVGPLSPFKFWRPLSQNNKKQACKGVASIFFTTSFVIWKCRNEVIFSNSRAS